MTAVKIAFKDTSEAGRAVYSTTPIPAGTLVLADRALFTIKMSSRSVEDVQLVVRGLAQDPLRAFLNLSNCHKGDDSVSAVIGTFKTNCLPAGGDEYVWVLSTAADMRVLPADRDAPLSLRSGIFPIAARFNHSCRPNCEAFFSTARQALEVHTLVEIQPDEELTISYLSARLLLPAADRIAHLEAAFNFTCVCPACTPPTTTSDSNRAEIARLKGEIDRLFPTDAEQAYACSQELRALCETETLWLERAFASATLAQVLIMYGVGGSPLAERWAATAAEEFAISRGKDGEDARRWQRWVGKTAEHPRNGCLGKFDFSKVE